MRANYLILKLKKKKPNAKRYRLANELGFFSLVIFLLSLFFSFGYISAGTIFIGSICLLTMYRNSGRSARNGKQLLAAVILLLATALYLLQLLNIIQLP